MIAEVEQDLEHIASSVQSKSSAGGDVASWNETKMNTIYPLFPKTSRRLSTGFQLSQTLVKSKNASEKRSAAVMSLPRANSAAYDSGREDAPSDYVMVENMEEQHTACVRLSWTGRIGKSTIAKTAAERAGKNKMLGGFLLFPSDAPLRNANPCLPDACVPTRTVG
ncbi:hypothetical protein BS47DRAFT_1402754 [Hydnum rufescens UP504]|uniref:Uncharacterized protein n=1 Tax=Hydnum rufescens UP504 TaxID=1448309 RepID=A0A9P6DEL1_9AGAM|nr:hypothetical protein BS47DRAFT_1402754 [Hydnum rufescens UP504]